jgi:transposase
MSESQYRLHKECACPECEKKYETLMKDIRRHREMLQSLRLIEHDLDADCRCADCREVRRIAGTL